MSLIDRGRTYLLRDDKDRGAQKAGRHAQEQVVGRESAAARFWTLHSYHNWI